MVSSCASCGGTRTGRQRGAGRGHGVAATRCRRATATLSGSERDLLFEALVARPDLVGAGLRSLARTPRPRVSDERWDETRRAAFMTPYEDEDPYVDECDCGACADCQGSRRPRARVRRRAPPLLDEYDATAPRAPIRTRRGCPGRSMRRLGPRARRASRRPSPRPPRTERDEETVVRAEAATRELPRRCHGPATGSAKSSE